MIPARIFVKKLLHGARSFQWNVDGAKFQPERTYEESVCAPFGCFCSFSTYLAKA